MSDPFSLQQAVFKEIVRTFPSVSEGMDAAIRTVASRRGQSAWRQCLKLDWRRSAVAFERWLRALFAAHPLPRSTRLLWFEVPDDANPALTSISAFDTFAPAQPEFGADGPRTWPVDRKGHTLPKGLLDLDDLETALRSVDAKDSEKLLPGAYALAHAYIALMVINVLPRVLSKDRVPKPDSMAVTIGWAAGDIEPLGMLTSDGWKPFRKPSLAERTAVRDPYQLKPSSPYFDPDVYIKAGLDINARDKWGRTVLAQCAFSDIGTIRRLIALGADIRARDNNGNGILHALGACEMPILRLLLKAGADPLCVNRRGESVLDRCLGDGRCTVTHLLTLMARGSKHRLIRSDYGSVLHAIATKTGRNAARKRDLRALLTFRVANGEQTEVRDSEGRTPLWVALSLHAKELTGHTRWLKENSVNAIDGGRWDSHHDDTAIMLLNLGADPNARLARSPEPLIPHGATPLMVRRYDDDKLVKALLRHGADPAARCAKGRTALYYAKKAAADPRRIDRTGAARVVEVLERALRKQAAKTR